MIYLVGGVSVNVVAAAQYFVVGTFAATSHAIEHELDLIGVQC